MGYLAVKGAEEAILAARALAGPTGGRQAVSAVAEHLPLVVDEIQAEAGVYEPRLAALAFTPARGDLAEAGVPLPPDPPAPPPRGARRRPGSRHPPAGVALPGQRVRGAAGARPGAGGHDDRVRVRQPAGVRAVPPAAGRVAGRRPAADGRPPPYGRAGTHRRATGDRGGSRRAAADRRGRHARRRLRLRTRPERTQGRRDGGTRRGARGRRRRRAVHQPVAGRGVRARARGRRGGRRLRGTHEAPARGDVRLRSRPGPRDPPTRPDPGKHGGQAMNRLSTLVARAGQRHGYSYAFLDEHTKRELRRRTLKAVAIPGHQVAFGSREMPLARGWGTGGGQLTLSLVGPRGTLEGIDQRDDPSRKAVQRRPLRGRH